MAKKIIKLSAAQEQRLVEVRENWLKAGLSCEPADFAAGDAIIREFYERIGKPAPMILHFSSPMMCELAVVSVMALLKDQPKQLGSQFGSQLWSKLGLQLWSQLRSQLELGSQLESQLWSKLGSQLELDSQLDSQLRSQLELDSQLASQLDSQLGTQLRSQLWTQLGTQLDSQLWTQLRSQLRSQLGEIRFTRNAFWGQHEAAWIAFYLFAAEVGAQYPAGDLALLQKWGGLARAIGWWAPWEGICFVSDRPRRVQFDAERRLHCETGMAVQFSDGWGVSAWHGTVVPDEWITDRKSLTPKIALTHPNIEQRRAACEILGWNAILTELNAKTIDADADPEIGELVEVEIPEIGRERFIRVRCGTGRAFALPVPPNMRTALEANAWTWGYDTSSFIVPMRT